MGLGMSLPRPLESMAAKLHDQRRFPRTCPDRSGPLKPILHRSSDLRPRIAHGGFVPRHRAGRASDVRAQAQLVQRRCRHFGASCDELGRDHVARPDPCHRGRRDRSLVRRDVRPRRQFARRDVDIAGHSDLCRAAAGDRRRRHRRPVQRRSRHVAQHSVLYRHARQLQPPLWRFAVDHQDLDLQPGLSAAGRRDSTRRA